MDAAAVAVTPGGAAMVAMMERLCSIMEAAVEEMCVEDTVGVEKAVVEAMGVVAGVSKEAEVGGEAGRKHKAKETTALVTEPACTGSSGLRREGGLFPRSPSSIRGVTGHPDPGPEAGHFQFPSQ